MQYKVIRAVLACALLAPTLPAAAAMRVAIASGNWNDSATWMDGLGPNPAGGDYVALHSGLSDPQFS